MVVGNTLSYSTQKPLPTRCMISADGPGWTVHDDELPIGHALSGAPMASFTWGFNANKNPLLLNIQNTGAQGVAVPGTVELPVKVGRSLNSRK